MQYVVVAIPVVDRFGNTNPCGRADEMAKFDPKLIKKVSHSRLIACSTEMGIKNADKVSKEILVSAYLDAVEKVAGEDQSKLTPDVVNTYNEIVTTLGLDKEEAPPTNDEEVAPAEATPAPAPVPAPAPAPTIQRRPAPTSTSTPSVAPPTPVAPKEKKVKGPKPPPKQSYTRHHSLRDSLKDMGGKGTIQGLIDKVNEHYTRNVGRNNPSESNLYTRNRITLLEILGYMKIDGDNFEMVK